MVLTTRYLIKFWGSAAGALWNTCKQSLRIVLPDPVPQQGQLPVGLTFQKGTGLFQFTVTVCVRGRREYCPVNLCLAYQYPKVM
jgi:hypothetical protein